MLGSVLRGEEGSLAPSDTTLDTSVLKAVNRLLGSQAFTNLFDTVWGLLKKNRISASRAFVNWHACGGPPVKCLEKFMIPYGNFHEIVKLGFMSESIENLNTDTVRRMTSPAWFNMICAGTIKCKNFLMRIDSFQLFDK